MPDPVSALTPEPYTSTSDAVLQIGNIFGLNMKFNTGAARVLADYLNGHDREVAKRAWNKGYAAGEDDEAFLSRGLRTDADANEHPHTNPYTEEPQND